MPAVFRTGTDYGPDIEALKAADTQRPTRSDLGMRTDLTDKYAVEDLKMPVTASLLQGPRAPSFSKILDQGGVSVSGHCICLSGASGCHAQGNGTFQDFSNDWSVSFWFKPDIAYQNRSRLIYKEDVFEVFIHRNKLYLRLYDRSSDANISPFLPNQRNHVVIVVEPSGSGANYTVYLNGVEVENDYRHMTVANNANDLYVGSEGGSRHWLNGCIDELRFYDALLDSHDVASLWNNGNGSEVQNIEQHTLPIKQQLGTLMKHLGPLVNTLHQPTTRH